jgi:hypothetical protein
MPALAAQGIPPSGQGGSIEHDEEFRESDVDESVFLAVPPGTAATAPLGILDLPGRPAVVATLTAPARMRFPGRARRSRPISPSTVCGRPAPRRT